MSSDDPFADNDRTVLRPIPGGRRPVPNVQENPFGNKPTAPVQPSVLTDEIPQVRPIPEQVDQAEFAMGQIIGAGINHLVDCASSLLLLGARLRNSISQDQIPRLREQIIQGLKTFETKARAGGNDQDAVLTARYLMCTYIDEAVLSTPWGSESGWSSQSLLSTFHNETWGGEKFFQILDLQLQNPGRRLDVLELIFVCLAFGFQGKYQLSESGNAQLTAIQDNLFQTITMRRGSFERELSPHWQGVPDKRYALTRYLPLWVVAAILGVLLLIIFTVFRFIISSNTSPVYDEIDRLMLQQNIENPQ